MYLFFRRMNRLSEGSDADNAGVEFPEALACILDVKRTIHV
jgi:hypothetical protein